MSAGSEMSGRVKGGRGPGKAAPRGSLPDDVRGVAWRLSRHYEFHLIKVNLI